MYGKRLPLKRINSIIISILAFLSIFVSDDVFVFSTIDSDFMVTLAYMIRIFVVCALLLFLLGEKKVEKKSFYIISMCALCVIISMIINRDYRMGYFFIIQVILTAYLISQFMSFEEINKLIYKVMYVICICSLIMYIMRFFWPALLNIFPIIYNVNGFPVYFGVFSNVPVYTGGFLRNYGPFREPGVFQAYIIIPLIYVMFCEKNISPKYAIVYILTIVTTYSTTGYIVLIAILLGLFFAKKNNMSTKQKKAAYCIMLLSVVGSLYMIFFTDVLIKNSYGSVFGKIFGGYESASANARYASIISNLYMMLENPLCGKGITYVEKMYPIISQEIFNQNIVANTNTLLMQGATYGIPLLILIIFSYINSVKNNYNVSYITRLCIIGAFFLLMFGESFIYTVFIYLPLFWRRKGNYKEMINYDKNMPY